MDEEHVQIMFDEGFDCSQIVLADVCARVGLTYEQALRAGAVFGVGMMHGSICGAATGAFIAIGLKYGNAAPGDMASKSAAIDKREEFLRRFAAANGEIVCSKMIGREVVSLAELIETGATTDIYKNCPRYCVNAMRILEDIL
jgi:C_GCAxxG_C_C family probable redox protein